MHAPSETARVYEDGVQAPPPRAPRGGLGRSRRLRAWSSSDGRAATASEEEEAAAAPWRDFIYDSTAMHLCFFCSRWKRARGAPRARSYLTDLYHSTYRYLSQRLAPGSAPSRTAPEVGE